MGQDAANWSDCKVIAEMNNHRCSDLLQKATAIYKEKERLSSVIFAWPLHEGLSLAPVSQYPPPDQYGDGGDEGWESSLCLAPVGTVDESCRDLTIPVPFLLRIAKISGYCFSN